MPPATDRSVKHSAAHKHHGHAAGLMSEIPPTAARRAAAASAPAAVTSSGRATKRRRSTLDAEFDYADHGSCSAQEERDEADDDGCGASESEEESSSGGQKKAGGRATSGGAISSAEAKRRRRQQQNRDAAATSRNRKKAYLTGLERKVAALEADNNRLRDELKAQARIIHSLRAANSGPINVAIVPKPVQVQPFHPAASAPSPVSPSSDGFHSSTPTSPMSRWDSNAHVSASSRSHSHSSHSSSAVSSHVASHSSSPSSSRLAPTRRVSPLSLDLDLDLNPSSMVGEGELHLHLADDLPMLTSPLLTKEPSAYQPLSYPVVSAAPAHASAVPSLRQSHFVADELDEVEAHRTHSHPHLHAHAHAPAPSHSHSSHPLSSHPSSFYSDSSCAVSSSPYLSVFGAEYNSLPTHGAVGGAAAAAHPSLPPFALPAAARFASSSPPQPVLTSCPSDRLYVPAVNYALQWQSIVVALWMAMAAWTTLSSNSSSSISMRELAPLDSLTHSLHSLSLTSPSIASPVHSSPSLLQQAPLIACT